MRDATRQGQPVGRRLCLEKVVSAPEQSGTRPSVDDGKERERRYKLGSGCEGRDVRQIVSINRTNECHTHTHARTHR